MKEHGLLLTAPMALARHERRKTQTRRLVSPYNSTIDGKRPGKRGLPDLYRSDNTVRVLDEEKQASWLSVIDPFENEAVFVKPEIQPGERIWWRETLLQWNDFVPAPVITYAATPGHKCTNPHADNNLDGWSIWPWKRDILPGIHMPRWAARHVDTVVRVRPERIQDISEEDSLAEGIQWHHNGYWHVDGTRILSYTSAVDCYRLLFESINGPEAWERNDWVWVYEWKLD